MMILILSSSRKLFQKICTCYPIRITIWLANSLVSTKLNSIDQLNPSADSGSLRLIIIELRLLLDAHMVPNCQKSATTSNSSHPYLFGPREHTPSPIDYEILKPFFCWLPTKLIKKTFENSTQYGTLPQSEHGNLFQRFRSPHPAMNVSRLNDDLLMDKIQSNTPAING